MPLLFVFLDGVGLGEDDATLNPLVAAHTPTLDVLFGGHLTKGLEPHASSERVVGLLEACLGIPGLPQSATGQATLLTGVNGAEIMGRHYGPWPGPSLKGLLDGGTLFTAASSATFANAYPPPFFEALEQGKRKLSVPLYSARAAGLRFRTHEDYACGKGISADLTGGHFQHTDAGLPLLNPKEAGKNLARLAARYSFTFFDFWLSDFAAHRWSFAEGVALVERLDAFLGGVVGALDGTTLLVTSDHGNLEDRRSTSHTFNPVPLLALGPDAGAFAGSESLLDVAPAAYRLI